MSHILSPGELALDQLITIYEWEPIVRDPSLDDAFGAAFGLVSTKAATRDNSWKGDILKVVAVMLPYVAVKQLTGGWGSDKPIQLDTRRVQLMEVTPEYAAAHGIICNPPQSSP